MIILKTGGMKNFGASSAEHVQGVEYALPTQKAFHRIIHWVFRALKFRESPKNSTCLCFKSIVYYTKKGKKTQRPLLRGSIQPDIRSVDALIWDCNRGRRGELYERYEGVHGYGCCI
jgi:hypothetical protein